MVRTNTPPVAEQVIFTPTESVCSEATTSEQKQNISEILNKFRQPIPSEFLELEAKRDRNFIGSMSGWKEIACSRYGFLIKGEWKQFDVSHELLEKLGLEIDKDIPYSVYLSPKVLEKESNMGAYDIISEEEIILINPQQIVVKEIGIQTEKDSEIISLIEQIEKLTDELERIKIEKEILENNECSNQLTIVSLEKEVANTKKQLSEAEKQKNRWQDKLLEEKGNNRNLIDKNDNYQNENKGLREKIRKLESDLKISQDKANKLRIELTNSKNYLAKLEKLKFASMLIFQKQNEKIFNLTQTLTEERNKNSSNVEYQKNLQVDLKELAKERKERERKIDQLEKEKEVLRQEKGNLERKCANLEEKNQELENPRRSSSPVRDYRRRRHDLLDI